MDPAARSQARRLCGLDVDSSAEDRNECDDDSSAAVQVYLACVDTLTLQADDHPGLLAKFTAIVTHFCDDVKEMTSTLGANSLRDVMMALSAATPASVNTGDPISERIAAVVKATFVLVGQTMATEQFAKTRLASSDETSPTRPQHLSTVCSWLDGAVAICGATDVFTVADASSHVTLDSTPGAEGGSADELMGCSMIASLALIALDAARQFIAVVVLPIVTEALRHEKSRSAASRVLSSLCTQFTRLAAAAVASNGELKIEVVTHLQERLQRVAENDIESTAVSAAHRAQIVQRRLRAQQMLAHRAASVARSCDCPGTNGGAETELASWRRSGEHRIRAQQAHELVCQFASLFVDVCDVVVRARGGSDEGEAKGQRCVQVFLSGRALAASAPLAVLVHEAMRAAVSSRGAEEAERSSKPDRLERYVGWATKHGLRSVVDDGNGDTDVPLPAPETLSADHPASVARAMQAMNDLQARDAARRARLVKLCSSSDDSDDADDDDDGGVESTSDGLAVHDPMYWVNHDAAVWFPPLDATGVGALLNCFRVTGVTADVGRTLTTRAQLERVIVPCIAMLRSDAAAAKLRGLELLVEHVLATPRYSYSLPADEERDGTTTDIFSEKPGENGVTTSPDEAWERFASSCDTSALQRFFLLAQEVVNCHVACPVADIRKIAGDLLPPLLFLLPERARLRLLAALLHRCPYSAGCGVLLGILKRNVEIDVAAVARDVERAATQANVRQSGVGGKGAALREVARRWLKPPHRPLFLSDAVVRFVTMAAKRWATTPTAIDAHADPLIAAVNLLRYLVSVDSRYLCGSLFPRDRHGAPADVTRLDDGDDDAPLRSASVLDDWLAGGEPLDAWPQPPPWAAASGRSADGSCGYPVALQRFLTAVVTPLTAWLGSRDGGKTVTTGKVALVSAAATPMALFALQSAVDGLCTDLCFTQS
jgi:hypothetical protein